MVFSSLPFLFLFLPAVLAGYFLLPFRFRNVLLLAANLIFYAYGEPIYVLLMLGSIAVNFFAALFIEKMKRVQVKKIALILSVALNLAALGWFKYAGFLIDALRRVSWLVWVPSVSVVLPIGISFYTFQAMSYVVDVYRGDCRASGNFLDFAAYISLFPQLIAGPIVRYSDVALQLRQRQHTSEKLSWGVRLFVIGLAKKVLLANQFAQLWEQVASDPLGAGAAACWLGMAAFALQIYFDFGGYSDMARGLGAMFGFDFCINFNYPYVSRSITEFWHRWHISLSTWFRDYVYIPLGGSRKGVVRTVCNLLVVWMLTGFWHGAGWNFLLWGLYYGILLVLEKFVFRKYLDALPHAVQWLYTMVFVLFGWILFASSDLNHALLYFRGLFATSSSSDLLSLIGWVPLFVVGCAACCPFVSDWYKRWEHMGFMPVLETGLCVLALILVVASLVSGSYNPFLYFRF